MISVYNEEDIIGEVIEHLLSQEIELVVLDGGSNDNSYEICKKFEDKGRIKLHQLKTSRFELGLNLRILHDMALTRSPDWLILSDADELLESGMRNITLKEAIEREDAEEYNLIQFDSFEFFMTNNDNELAGSVKQRFQYYSWQHDFVYRAWKHYPGIRADAAGGHLPIFPDEQGYRISPRKFIIRHYNFRTMEQAKRKINERISRTRDTAERRMGWHAHYDYIATQEFPLITDYRMLVKYEEDNNWNRERKFHPYVNYAGEMPSRDILFYKDGRLKVRYPTLFEFRSELSKDPMGTLLSVYHLRNDLQQAFPEVRNGEYDRLLEWAVKHGTTTDAAKHVLLAHKDWYRSRTSYGKFPTTFMRIFK